MPIQNNNDDPGFERRLILAFALMVLLFLVVLPFLNKKSKMPTLQQAEKIRQSVTKAPPSASSQPSSSATPPSV
ncbi:MAG: hypothetical protein ACRD1F_10875, partial [Terriglobales bacterium]